MLTIQILDQSGIMKRPNGDYQLNIQGSDTLTVSQIFITSLITGLKGKVYFN